VSIFEGFAVCPNLQVSAEHGCASRCSCFKPQRNACCCFLIRGTCSLHVARQSGELLKSFSICSSARLDDLCRHTDTKKKQARRNLLDLLLYTSEVVRFRSYESANAAFATGTADAAVLPAGPGQIRTDPIAAVEVRCARLHLLQDAFGTDPVHPVDCCRQSVLAVVHHLNRGVVRGDSAHAHDRAEGLVLHDAHALRGDVVDSQEVMSVLPTILGLGVLYLIDVHQHGGLKEVAVHFAPSAEDGSSSSNCVRDLSF